MFIGIVVTPCKLETHYLYINKNVGLPPAKFSKSDIIIMNKLSIIGIKPNMVMITTCV